MHGCEQDIVAPVLKMRDASLLAPEILNARRSVDSWYAPPGKSDGRFNVEIVSAHPAGLLHDLPQRGNGIYAKAEQRIPDVTAQGLEARQYVGYSSPGYT